MDRRFLLLVAFVGLVVVGSSRGCDKPVEPPAAPVTRAPAFVPPAAEPTATAAEVVVEELDVRGLERQATYHTGYVPHPLESRQFLQSLPEPELKDAAPHFFDARGPPAAATDDGEPVLLYRALHAAHRAKFGRDWVVGKQGIGDCVSWGWSHGAQILLAIDYVQGRSGDYDVVATEAAYGLMRVEGAGRSRGGYSDGCYGAAAAKAFTKFGATFRRDYTALASGECDLRIYSPSRAKQWGNFGCGGKDDDGRLDGEAKKHGCKQVALCASSDEAGVAIRNGYPVPVCSGQGFSSRRDSDGFCAPRGSWSHCMVFIGVRGGDRPGLLCLNSWGPNWVSGPKWPSDQPEGSFWVDWKTADRMLRGRDSYAMSNLVGFPRQELRLVRGL